MCKMLNQNPSRISSARGWILFSCLAGCFVPSDALHAAVEKFLERGPPGFRAYLTERMKRTKANGPRHQATSWMELNAVKMKKKLDIEVISMDKRKTVLQCDSATTAGELHAAMCDSLGLKGSDGFSFMVNFAGKIFAIRDPSHHIMDAVAQVEQAGKVKDGEEKDVHWKMYFRKEEVAAGFDVKADAKHTTLMYHQVIAGLKCGKYGVEADVSALANLCAQHFYVMYQDNMCVTAPCRGPACLHHAAPLLDCAMPRPCLLAQCRGPACLRTHSKAARPCADARATHWCV